MTAAAIQFQSSDPSIILSSNNTIAITAGTDVVLTNRDYYYTTGTSVGTVSNRIYNIPTTGSATLGYTTTGTNWFYNDSTGTNWFYNDSTITNSGLAYTYFDPKAEARSFMKRRLLVKQGASKTLDRQISPQELKARNLLRDMLTEKDWRRYVTNGFIMVRGQSGKFYQIFNKQAGYLVQVYENNKNIAGLCIHTVDNCPPTDHVINMKVLVELDEEQIYKLANVRSAGNSRMEAPKAELPSLLDFFKSLKTPGHAALIHNTSAFTIEGDWALGA